MLGCSDHRWGDGELLLQPEVGADIKIAKTRIPAGAGFTALSVRREGAPFHLSIVENRDITTVGDYDGALSNVSTSCRLTPFVIQLSH